MIVTKKVLHFALIGCGNIGVRHAEQMQTLPRAKLYAVCDGVEERAKNVANTYHCKTYTDYKEMLKDKEIDVVIVAVPNGLHGKVCIEAMNSGKHVLCEKPMTLTNEDADAIVEAEKRNKVKLFLVKQNRYNPPVAALKELIRTGKLGRIFLITVNAFWNRNDEYYTQAPWRGTKDLDGGALFTQFSHFLDLMLWMGGNLQSVHAKMKLQNHKIETEDTGVINLTFKNGALGTMQYTTCTYSKNLEGSITVIAENGTVKIGGEYLNELEHWDVKDVPKPEFTLDLLPNGTVRKSNHHKVIENVIFALLDGEKAATPAEQGRYGVHIMNAIYESANTGKEITFKQNEGDFWNEEWRDE